MCSALWEAAILPAACISKPLSKRKAAQCSLLAWETRQVASAVWKPSCLASELRGQPCPSLYPLEGPSVTDTRGSWTAGELKNVSKKALLYLLSCSLFQRYLYAHTLLCRSACQETFPTGLAGRGGTVVACYLLTTTTSSCFLLLSFF